MTDAEWEKQRARCIAAAFQTGRPVCADTDGALRFADGDCELVPADVGLVKQPIPAVELIRRSQRSSRLVCVTSSVAAGINAIAGIWHPWSFVAAGVFTFSAVVWYHLSRPRHGVK